MHILVLPSWYPTKEDPISGSFFAEQAKALARFGHKVSVFALFGDAGRGIYVEEAREGTFTEYAIHVKPLRFHLTVLPVVRTMMKLLRGNRPDIIHVHSFEAIRYARILKLLYGIPFVVTEHVTWFERGLLSEAELGAITKDYAAADAVYAVSTGLARTITPYCPGKTVKVIPNMVSDRFFAGGLHAPAEECVGFISAGALTEKKGMDVLLRAFGRVRAQEEKVRLTVCGGGEEEQTLRALAASLGIADAVTFTGQVSREEIARRLRENQIFVLPSRTETFGVVFVEAMACGLPIVMTKTNAWELLAVKETGLAVDIDDETALADAMLSVLHDPGSYDAETIRAYCRDRFSEEAVCRTLTENYESVLAGRKENN